jgi:hypothetical protein
MKYIEELESEIRRLDNIIDSQSTRTAELERQNAELDQRISRKELPGKFWVVTLPDKNSVLVDICFETDMPGLRNQFYGGLTAQQIYDIYFDEYTATAQANRLLQKRKG